MRKYIYRLKLFLIFINYVLVYLNNGFNLSKKFSRENFLKNLFVGGS